MTYTSGCTRSGGTEEEWRPVVGFEGRYEVSDQGRVRSLRRPGVRGGILKAWQQHGYANVNLYRPGERETFRVHRLVLMAFDRLPSPVEVGRHLNGDSSDNRRSNLAWGTSSENAHDAIRHGTHTTASATACRRGHPFDSENTLTYQTATGRRRFCRKCKSANRKPPTPIRPGDGDPRHGTGNGYDHHCRCAACRAANTDRIARHRAKRTSSATPATVGGR